MATILPGTLDVLVLKAVSLGSEHGFGLLQRIRTLSAGALEVEQGALYPALARLESQGLVDAEWGTSDNNRRAKYYRLTRTGRARLEQQRNEWQALADAMALVLGAGKGAAT